MRKQVDNNTENDNIVKVVYSFCLKDHNILCAFITYTFQYSTILFKRVMNDTVDVNKDDERANDR